MRSLSLSITIVLFLTASAHANLADDKIWDEAMVTVGVSQKKLAKVCGTEIPIAFDKDSFKEAPKAGKTKEKPGSTCDQAYTAVEALCRSKTSQTAVVGKIKQIECKYDPHAQKPTVALEGGKLVVAMHSNTTGSYGVIKDWLEHNL